MRAESLFSVIRLAPLEGCHVEFTEAETYVGDRIVTPINWSTTGKMEFRLGKGVDIAGNRASYITQSAGLYLLAYSQHMMANQSTESSEIRVLISIANQNLLDTGLYAMRGRQQ